MNTVFYDIDFPFVLEGVVFHAHNLSLDTFTVPLPGHRHGSGCYEVHYVTSGYGTLQMEQDFYRIIPNTLYMTGPHIYHVQIPDKENPMTEYCIYIQPDLAMLHAHIQSIPDSFLKDFLSITQWFGQDTQGLSSILEAVFLELNLQQTGYGSAVTSLLQQLLVRIVRNISCKKVPRQLPFLSPTDSMSLITEKCFLFEYATITLEELAGRLGISPRQTERFLKNRYGKTFQQQKRNARMAAAISFLMDPSLRITRISENLGYSSVEHFSYAFRSYYGISAGSYRKKLLAGASLPTSG